jgi:hypothetical protein
VAVPVPVVTLALPWLAVACVTVEITGVGGVAWM